MLRTLASGPGESVHGRVGDEACRIPATSAGLAARKAGACRTGWMPAGSWLQTERAAAGRLLRDAVLESRRRRWPGRSRLRVGRQRARTPGASSLPCGNGEPTCCCRSCSRTATWTGPPTRAPTRWSPARAGCCSPASRPAAPPPSPAPTWSSCPALAADRRGQPAGARRRFLRPGAGQGRRRPSPRRPALRRRAARRGAGRPARPAGAGRGPARQGITSLPLAVATI